MHPENTKRWVVKPLVPEEVYTDRQKFLEYFYNAALKAAYRRTTSTVLLGQRRMGKTEIFKRVVNRLFFEQDPKDPHAVVPVYYSFPEQQMDIKSFSLNYLENFIRYYVSFKTSQPHIIDLELNGKELMDTVEASRHLYPFTRTFDYLFTWHRMIETDQAPLPHQHVLETPRRISDIDDSTIVMFLDEFQNTRLPHYNFEIVGFMQEAVESPTCPHFVTGSAMSILAREIIGRGSLYGRFRGHEIEPLTQYWGKELVLRAACYYKAEVPATMASAIAERCGGNPFYITAVVQQAAELNQPVASEEELNHILAVDLSSGFIWGELNDQVTRWISRINEHSITKWVLYLSALDENTEEDKKGRLNVERIHEEIQKREGRDVSFDMIRDVLIKLSRGDLLEYLELGGWFRRIKDPILVEFLKVWGRIEVEGSDRNLVQYTLQSRYDKMKRRISEYKGYFAEVHMSQILLNGQRKKLSSRFFHARKDIVIPDFIFVRHRMRLESGRGQEIDVIAAAAPEVWVCQSKWLKNRKIGVGILKDLMSQAEIVQKDLDPKIIRKWIFAHDGLTPQAKAFAEKNGIFWTVRKEFDELLVHVGLRPLPEL